MLQQALQDKSISEYLSFGIIFLGFLLFMLIKFSPVGIRIKDHFEEKQKRKEDRYLELMKQANEPL